MAAIVTPIPLPATSDTSAYARFVALGVSPSDARWLSGPSESLALDMSVAAILGAAQP